MSHILNQLEYLLKCLEIVNNIIFFNFLYLILAPQPQRCFSIYATSKMKEKVFNIKCEEEGDATDFIDNLKIVMDFMSKNKTIKNAVQFSLCYKN